MWEYVVLKMRGAETNMRGLKLISQFEAIGPGLPKVPR
jgi:hypothetical protein